jgi:hypothetical protein
MAYPTDCRPEIAPSGPLRTPRDPENACPKTALRLCVSKLRPGFLFPVDDVKSFSHDENNVNIVRRALVDHHGQCRPVQRYFTE